jgi:sigma-E factor negative regulatory protein RseA
MDKISALMDGEAEGQEARQAMLRLGDTGEARETWATYHLIGDVMRGEALPAFNISPRVAAAIAREPAIVAPQPARRASRPLTYALSAAASVSAIAVVGWMAFSTGSIVTPPAEVARAVVPAAVPQPQPEAQLVSSPSDGLMNEYLLAHQGVSPGNSLHGVAPYIRTISIAPAAGR